MTKQQQHAAVGAVIVAAGVIYLVHRRGGGGPADQLAGESLPVSYGTIPDTTSTVGAATPGTDIDLGGSPTYLSYNYPALSSPDYNPPWGDVINPPAGAGDMDGTTPAGSCCDSCKGQQWTNAGLVRNYWPGAAAVGANLSAVGLASNFTTGISETGGV